MLTVAINGCPLLHSQVNGFVLPAEDLVELRVSEQELEQVVDWTVVRLEPQNEANKTEDTKSVENTWGDSTCWVSSDAISPAGQKDNHDQ